MGQKREKEEKKLKRRNKWESTKKEDNKNEDERQRGEKSRSEGSNKVRTLS